jgi:septum formation protein
LGLNPKLVLASSSPRRRDLLARLGVVPDRVASPDIDEAPRKGEVPRVYALRMAEEKAQAAARGEGEIVLAGDTTVAVIDTDGRLRSRISDSVVRFKRLGEEEIEAYVASGEGLGKAGGYAIQGRAEALVDWMAGSHSGVVGFPLYETRALLRAAGYPLD